MQINERLREIRERKDLSQTDFAQIGGVSLRSQQQYEKGNVFPNADYLQRIAEAGYDVHYLLTGKRQAEMLDDMEAELVRQWRAAEPLIRIAAFNVLATGKNDKIGNNDADKTKNNIVTSIGGIGTNTAGRDINGDDR